MKTSQIEEYRGRAGRKLNTPLINLHTSSSEPVSLTLESAARAELIAL